MNGLPWLHPAIHEYVIWSRSEKVLSFPAAVDGTRPRRRRLFLLDEVVEVEEEEEEDDDDSFMAARPIPMHCITHAVMGAVDAYIPPALMLAAWCRLVGAVCCLFC